MVRAFTYGLLVDLFAEYLKTYPDSFDIRCRTADITDEFIDIFGKNVIIYNNEAILYKKIGNAAVFYMELFTLKDWKTFNLIVTPYAFDISIGYKSDHFKS